MAQLFLGEEEFVYWLSSHVCQRFVSRVLIVPNSGSHKWGLRVGSYCAPCLVSVGMGGQRPLV